MDCRSAAHALTQIAVLLELHGEDRFTVQALHAGARQVAAFGEASLRETLHDGGLRLDAFPPAVADILRDLDETKR